MSHIRVCSQTQTYTTTTYLTFFRLYSDYYHTTTKGSTSPGDFHNKVVLMMKAYTECFEVHTLPQCVHNNTLRDVLIEVNTVKHSIWFLVDNQLIVPQTISFSSNRENCKKRYDIPMVFRSSDFQVCSLSSFFNKWQLFT